MAVPPAWDRRCLRYRRRELWPLLSPFSDSHFRPGNRRPLCGDFLRTSGWILRNDFCAPSGSRTGALNLVLPTGRSCRLVLGNRLQRILFQGEDMLGDNPISPLARGRLAVELRVGKADE